MLKQLATTATILFATASQAQGLGFTGVEKIYGPEPYPGYYGGKADGAPVDKANTYFSAYVVNPAALTTSIDFGYLRLGDILGAASRNAIRRAAELSALASSVTITSPNPGDRFAFALSGATVGGRTAGSASASYRISNRSMVFAAAARSEDHTLAKGGISLSVH